EQPLYQLARQVGSVFQNPKSQFFNMDSDSELAFGLENQGMTRGEILRRLDDTTDRLHLKRLRGRNIFAMSGGEKQLLVFDEPTSGLGYARMQEVACCARELADEGRVVLVVTHDREFLQC